MTKAPAYIFNFDGTVADTCHLIVEAKMQVCDIMGIRRPDKDFLESLSGMTVEDTFVLATGIDDIVIRHESVELYHKILLKLTIETAQLFSGFYDLIKWLRSENAKVAILSRRLPHHFEKLVQHFGIEKLVNAWVTEEEAGKPKPAPDMILNLTDRLGVPVERTMMVGDTIYDLEMARNAGARPVAVTFGSQSRRMLEFYKPELIVDSFHDFVPASAR